MKLRSRVCPICESTDSTRAFLAANYDESKLGAFSFASRKLPEFMHFRMVCCPTCDLLYTTPAPDPNWMRQQYQDADFDGGEESRYAALTYARHLGQIVNRLPDRQSALDIGAGDGAFLEKLLDAGFSRVMGVEPSRAPLKQAKQEIRPLIREGFFRGDDFDAERWTLVSCFQTLEHTDDPAELCAAGYRLLKPGGAFLATAHNYRSVSARILKTRSPIYDIEHLQLHSPRSLRFMLERAGFKDVSVKVLRNDYPLTYWFKLLPIGLGLKKKLMGGLRMTRLGKLVIPVWAGNLVAVGYKPRQSERAIRS